MTADTALSAGRPPLPPRRWERTRPTARLEVSANFWISLALWLSFAGLFARTFGQSIGTLRHAGRFLFDISAVILILASLPRLLGLSQRRHTQYTLVLLLLAAGLVAGIVGLANQNAPVRWVLLGFLPFMSAASSILGDSEGLFDTLLRTLLRQLWVGVLFASYVLIFARPAGRAEWHGDFGEGPAKMATRLLYAVPFLLPYVGRLRLANNALLTVAWLQLLALHIMGANRGPILAVAVIMPATLMLISWVKGDGFVAARKLMQGFAITCLLLSPVVNLALVGDPALLDYAHERLGETLARLSGTSQDDDLLTTSEGAVTMTTGEFLSEQNRGGELRDFWRQLEPVDFACGRGFGGGWVSTFWGTEWFMVHVGPAHLILVGGIPLMVAFLAMLFGSIGAAWRALTVHPAAEGTLCYLLVFTLGFMQHGAIQDDIEVALFWVLTGLAFAVSPAPQVLPSPIRTRRMASQRI